MTSRIDQANHGIVFARTSQDGRDGISGFIVDLPAEGLSWRRVEVIRDHHTNEVLLDDVFVAEGVAAWVSWAEASRWRSAG